MRIRYETERKKGEKNIKECNNTSIIKLKIQVSETQMQINELKRQREIRHTKGISVIYVSQHIFA